MIWGYIQTWFWRFLAGTPEKTIPLRHTCRYYRTWKPLRDTLICQKHTTFAMIIHHASYDLICTVFIKNHFEIIRGCFFSLLVPWLEVQPEEVPSRSRWAMAESSGTPAQVADGSRITSTSAGRSSRWATAESSGTPAQVADGSRITSTSASRSRWATASVLILSFSGVDISPNSLLLGFLNAPLDLAALCWLVWPPSWALKWLSPFMWGVGLGWCGRI